MFTRSTTTVLEDGTVVPSVRKINGRKGKGRRGYHAADLLVAMTGADLANEWPTFDKPKVMIDTMRVVGPDDLTARDQAVYEFLLARARAAGIKLERHSIPVKEIMAYLDVDSVERVIDSLDRIARTVVRYDIRDEEQRRRGWLHLIEAEVTEDLSSGRATLNYSIPAAVRRIILESRSFRRLEVRAFARFRSRYTARLYQRLALRAGYTHKGFNHREPWIVDPRKFADELGYPVGERWNYKHFERNVIEPAMEDIRLHVKRFGARFERGKSGPGRGSPVAEIKFFVSPETPPLAEVPPRRVVPSEAEYIVTPDPEHLPRELPSANAILRAAGYLKRPATEVSDGYRAALAIAKRNKSAFVSPPGARCHMAAGWFLNTLESDGPDPALEAWVKELRVGREIVLERPTSPLPVAAAPAPAPVTPKPPSVLKGGLGATPAPARAAAPVPAPKPAAPVKARATYVSSWDRPNVDTPAQAQRRQTSYLDLTEESMGFDKYAALAAFGDFDDRDASDDECEADRKAAAAPAFDPLEHFAPDDLPVSAPEDEGYIMPVDED